MEIANECGVHTTDCNTTWQEMIDLHIAVADALHAAYINVSSSGTSIPKPLVRTAPRAFLCSPCPPSFFITYAKNSMALL